MPDLDWSQCKAVESVAGRVSGAWVFKNSRMPVATVFENLETGANIEDLTALFDVSREEVLAVLTFVTESLQSPPNLHKPAPELVDAHSL